MLRFEFLCTGFVSITLAFTSLAKAETCKLTEKETTQLFIAAINIDDVNCVQKALSQNLSLEKDLKIGSVSVRNWNNLMPPLSYAAFKGALKSIQALVDAGASINYAGKHSWGMTPLHYAAVGEKIDSITLLLRRGADIESDPVDADGYHRRSPLLMATECDAYTSAQALLMSGAKVDYSGGAYSPSLVYTPLIYVSGHSPRLKNQMKFVELFIAYGANLNFETYTSPIHSAAYSSSVAILKLLVDAGADVNLVQDAGKWTPLMYAVLNTDPSVIKYLIEQGAHIDAKDSGKVNSLMRAARNGKFEGVEALVSAGAHLNEVTNSYSKSNERTTALDLAIEEGNTAIAEYLRSKGAKRASEIKIDASGM